MIAAVNDIPDLTESWIAPLRTADRALYDELAESLVVSRAEAPVRLDLPAGVSETLSQIDLCGKEIGAFRFAPASGASAIEQIDTYDRLIRDSYEVEGDIIFIGEYGSGNIFVSPMGVGLLDAVSQPPEIRALSPSFGAFLIAQANAYDAYKRHLVKANDLDGYRASAAACAAIPALANTDVQAIFEAQKTA